MRKYLLLALVLFAVAVSAQDPERPRHDKYRDDPHARCFFGTEPYEGQPSMHPCQCQPVCTEEGHQVEDGRCALYCSADRCLCHVDQDICGMDDVVKGKK